MHLTVGPYTFTGTDAVRTFGNVAPWWHELTVGLAADDLAPLGERLHATVASLGELTVAALGELPPGRAEAALASVLADLAEVAAVLRRTGRIAVEGRGAVAALHASGGGVPKHPVEHVHVGFAGVDGDRQATRVHHGRPWQALCLWSAEVIDAFAAQGHPVRPGGAGENVTVRDLPWDRVRPGVRLRIGEVLCEASLYALPCQQTAFNFRDGDFRVMHHERGPVSRMYATVLEPGRIGIGDPVTLVA